MLKRFCIWCRVKIDEDSYDYRHCSAACYDKTLEYRRWVKKRAAELRAEARLSRGRHDRGYRDDPDAGGSSHFDEAYDDSDDAHTNLSGMK